MEVLKELYDCGRIEREKVIEKFEGWLAYAAQGNTYKYRKQLTSQFNELFPAQPPVAVTSAKKHENFNHQVDASALLFTVDKTRWLFQKGFTVKQIAEQRGIKISTVWNHLACLIEHHQLHLKEVLPQKKIKKILVNIRSPKDTLKEIKARIVDETIIYEEIHCVLANSRGKQQKKSTQYFVDWYQKVNCLRKCYFNKQQRKDCRLKFQLLAAQFPNRQFSKEEFLEFVNNHTTICVLPEQEKRKFVSWKEFRVRLRRPKSGLQ